MGLHPAVHILGWEEHNWLYQFSKRHGQGLSCSNFTACCDVGCGSGWKTSSRVSYNEVKSVSSTKTPEASECSEGSHSKNHWIIQNWERLMGDDEEVPMTDYIFCIF